MRAIESLGKSRALASTDVHRFCLLLPDRGLNQRPIKCAISSNILHAYQDLRTSIRYIPIKL
jgi:hypothetical protein